MKFQLKKDSNALCGYEKKNAWNENFVKKLELKLTKEFYPFSISIESTKTLDDVFYATFVTINNLENLKYFAVKFKRIELTPHVITILD